MSHPLKEICNRLDRALKLLDEATAGAHRVKATGDWAASDLEHAQWIVERFTPLPKIELVLGPTPTGLAPWHGANAWRASAIWGTGDHPVDAYGATWAGALCELAALLELETPLEEK